MDNNNKNKSEFYVEALLWLQHLRRNPEMWETAIKNILIYCKKGNLKLKDLNTSFWELANLKIKGQILNEINKFLQQQSSTKNPFNF